MENELLRGKRILVVEDDASSKLYLNKILEKAGVEILNAADGEEAVTVALNNDVDIVLMDIQLPIIDGYAAMGKIREVKKDLIIIAQTAYGLLGDREKIINSGFTDFIIKPILYQNLIEKLVSNLNRNK
jgi:CheY-like chemotaxis protein